MQARPTAPRLVFVIIHGTASRGAWWTRPESRIRRRLARHFDRRGHSVSFEWSGANTNVARLTAGRDLARRILELHEEFHVPIYLIGHSHGGTIALYSMRDPAVEARVAGVICIGTLFLKCSPRPFAPAIEKSLSLLPRLAATTILGAIALLHTTSSATFNPWFQWAPILLVSLMFLSRNQWMPSYQAACGQWVQKLRTYSQSRSNSTITTLSLPRLPNLRLLCLSSPNDEASKGLRLAIFLSELPFMIWRSLDTLSDLVIAPKTKPSKWITIPFYIAVAAAIACLLHVDRKIPWLHWLTFLAIPCTAVLTILIIIPALLLLYQLLLTISPHLPAILSHGFRTRESPLDNWFTRITVAPAPESPKNCLVKEVNVTSGKLNFFARNFRTFLAASAHTRLYNNREVLGTIIRWIYKTQETRS
jgi:pimeloyl-ACP methyl ester carboxylesterase